jgi:hypothetical protein
VAGGEPGRRWAMSAIRGRYIDGKVVLDAPADWPEGAEVTVTPAEEYVGIGMREEDWDDSPEGVARWIARIDSLQPFLSPEEEAEWQKARAEQKAWQLAHWEERCRKIEELFE